MTPAGRCRGDTGVVEGRPRGGEGEAAAVLRRPERPVSAISEAMTPAVPPSQGQPRESRLAFLPKRSGRAMRYTHHPQRDYLQRQDCGDDRTDNG